MHANASGRGRHVAEGDPRRRDQGQGRHRGPVSPAQPVRRGRAAVLAAAIAVSTTALLGGMLAEAEPGVPGVGPVARPSAPATSADPDVVRPSPDRTVGPDTEPSAAPASEAASVSKPSGRPRPVRVPEAGSGTFDRAAADRETPGAVLTYSVEVERDLPISLSAFTGVVRRTLADPRGWTRGDPAALAMTDGEPDMRIVLTTPETTDRLCAPLQTRGRVSCRNGQNVVINAYRWVNGATSYGSDLAGYRRYVINHEVGHALGNGHEACPEPGGLSPVMLQQTLGLQGCRSNPWPSRVDLLAQ